jgi:hypothetical protein
MNRVHIKSHLFKSQVRKAVFEVNNQEMVSSCWITNTQFVSDSLKITLSGGKLNGYVQRFDVSAAVTILFNIIQ